MSPKTKLSSDLFSDAEVQEVNELPCDVKVVMTWNWRYLFFRIPDRACHADHKSENSFSTSCLVCVLWAFEVVKLSASDAKFDIAL